MSRPVGQENGSRTSPSRAASTASIAPDLTFGIEVEGTLLFTEQQVREHLPTDTIINKDLGGDAERALRYLKYPHNPYRSWSFQPSNTDAAPRRYTSEHMRIAKRLLHEAEAKSIATPQIKICEDKDNVENYDTWQLMSDNSLIALDTTEKADALEAMNISSEEHSEYDSRGLELVSPPYRLSQLNLMHQHLSSLTSALNTYPNKLVTNKSCGLHVHVGLPDGSPKSLDALRNAALLTIAFENHISLLHPAHRGDSSSSDLQSNEFEQIYAEGNDERDETLIDGKTFESTAKSFKSVRKAMYETSIHDKNNDYDSLIRVMGKSRLSIVHWTRINRKSEPATLEFRQHDGTLSATEIGHWVQFCVGLVSLGYKYTADGKQVLPEMESWAHKLSLESLLIEMAEKTEFPQASADYYIDKYVKATVAGRDPEEGIWEEKWDDDDDLYGLSSDQR